MSIKLGNTNISSILSSSGAPSGTTDYTDLTNKPSINGVTLVGNKTTSDLGITISTDDFYTKAETDAKINTEVETAVQPKADKTYVDNQLNLKVSNSDLNTALALKADKSNTYTKTETNTAISSAISTKADTSYVNTALDSKASIDDVYDKDEVDAQIDAVELSMNNALATKADKTTTYTKTETDAAINTTISDRATITYVNTGLATKANQSTTYTKTEVDELISESGPTGDTLPIGSIIPYSGQVTPENWLLCDGREVSRTTYSQLFNVIGTIYGAGDGSTSFNLPNLTDRVPVGTSNDITLGQTLGEKEHTLTINEIPAHMHSLALNRSSGDQSWGGFIGVKNVDGVTFGSGNTSETGGGQAHNVMQPSIGQNYIIKAKQSAGVVATVVDTLTSTSATNALSANQGRLLNNKMHCAILSKTDDRAFGNTYKDVTWQSVEDSSNCIELAENKKDIKINCDAKFVIMILSMGTSVRTQLYFRVDKNGTQYVNQWDSVNGDSMHNMTHIVPVQKGDVLKVVFYSSASINTSEVQNHLAVFVIN